MLCTISFEFPKDVFGTKGRILLDSYVWEEEKKNLEKKRVGS